MQTILHNLRFALRQLRRAPGFTLTVVLTLALGIGANTAIFSLLDQALLRSLPVRDPASLVVLAGTTSAWNGSTSGYGGDELAYFDYPMYKNLRDQNHAFAGLISTAPATVGLTHGSRAEAVSAELVSGNYFDVLGIVPAAGRLLTQTDDRVAGAAPLAVLSYDYWHDRLGADAAAVGSTVRLNGQPFQVIGVAAPGFHSAVWGQLPAVFLPMAMADAISDQPGQHRLSDPHNRWINILGRLNPGETRAQAAASVAPLWHALREEQFKGMKNDSARFRREFLDKSRLQVLPGARGFSYTRDTLQTPFYVVMAMAVLGLLIAAVNVAGLLLVRGAGRVREFALRAALGAQGSRVLGQLMLEGVLLGVLGGAAGLMLAPLALHVLVGRLADADGVTAFSSALDLRVLLFNFAVAIAVSLLFSLAPALQLRRMNLVSTLRESSSTGSGSLLRLRHVVVSVQIGLGVVLLIGAGLFVRTMERLRAVNPGFNTTHLVAFWLDPALSGYTDPPVLQTLDRRLLDALGAVPGVQFAGATTDSELANNSSYSNITVAGFRPPPDTSFNVETPVVSSSYFATMQLPILAGRSLSASDTANHPKAVVVNEAFVRHFCKNAADCLGRRTALGEGNTAVPDMEIVGVARDVHHIDLRTPARATMYRALAQVPETTGLTFYARTAAAPASMFEPLRHAVRSVDPGLAVAGMTTMEAQVDTSLQNERMIELLSVSFGLLAAVLAGVGLYGVLAFTTAQRTREIGIRMALGSTRAAISRLVLGDVVRLAAIGVLLAIPVAWGLSRLIAAQLYEASVADPLLLGGVLLLIMLVAAVAALIPARRAVSVEPTVALRTE